MPGFVPLALAKIVSLAAGRTAEGIPGRSRFLGSKLLLAVLATLGIASVPTPSIAEADQARDVWIETWGAAPQPFLPGALQTFRNQTLRLIVHTSAGGSRIRIRISNIYGDEPLFIGSAHVARRTEGADIDSASDRTLKFDGQLSATVPARSMLVSDPVELKLSALSDVAISLFLPRTTEARTTHILAMQTSYVSSETGDASAAVKFPIAKKLRSWPFLTGVDVSTSAGGTAIVAFGSSLTDGDGSTVDTNGRWPDVLAERLQKKPGGTEVGIVNEGIIGNRLLSDSPQEQASLFGAALGQSGLSRFERDVLEQPGVKFVIVGLGINDIAFPGSLTPLSQMVSAQSMISGYRELIARAHKKGIRVIGTTNPPFEDSFLKNPPVKFYTPDKEAVRQNVNDWIRRGGEFDGIIDFDKVLRDPDHPTRLLPAYDSGDHLHPNNAGYAASGNAVPLELFDVR